MVHSDDITRSQASFIGSVIGDSLGLLFEGHSRAHIHSCMRDFTGFPDPAPLLKGKMERWSKPGLYSSLTQIMIIAAISQNEHNFDEKRFREILSICPSIADSDSGIFRHAGMAEKNLLIRISRGDAAQTPATDQPSGRIIPLTLPMAMHAPDMVKDTLSLVTHFTKNPETAATCLLFVHGVRALCNADDESALDVFIAQGKNLALRLDSLSPLLFSAGVNPEAVISALARLNILLSRLHKKTPSEAEKIILEQLNPLLKTPVTRATVDDPRCLLPYAIAVTDSLADSPETIIKSAAREGGSSSALAMICGTLAGTIHGPLALNEEHIRDLVNKKRILEIMAMLSDCNGYRIRVEAFLKEEYSLTMKERDELRARLKHEHKPDKISGEKSRREKEDALSRHTVESWTKLDKAKWKKERNRKPAD